MGSISHVDHVTGFSGRFPVGSWIDLPILLKKSLIELGHSGSFHTEYTRSRYSGSGILLCLRNINAIPSGKDKAEAPVMPLFFRKSHDTERAIRRAK